MSDRPKGDEAPEPAPRQGPSLTRPRLHVLGRDARGVPVVIRPRVYTLPEAAQRIGVSEETIRTWMRRRALQPLPGSCRLLGYNLFAEPALVEAEHRFAAGRHRHAPGRQRRSRLTGDRV